MALVLPNSIFFHMPKTGGTFVRKTIADLGIPHHEVGGEHINVSDFSAQYPSELGDKFIFWFVRQPFSWWQSYWGHRIQHGWSLQHPMDRACNSNDFEIYMEQILCCDWKYHYLNNYRSFNARPPDYVGRQENLVKDLGEAMLRAGEKFDKASLGRLGIINKSISDYPACSKNTKALVTQLHQEIIDHHYPVSKSLLSKIYSGLKRK